MTPLQILALFNAVANQGKMVKPIFVEEMRSHGKSVKRFQTKVLNNHICSRETLEQIQAMLKGVVTNGTARNLANTNYTIAGKTGTAQVSTSKEGYTKSLYQASFAGYFPADNPKYSCIVVVNAPSRSIYYGNLVAGPIFRAITDRIYVREFELHQEKVLLAQESVQAPYSKSGSSNALESILDYLELPARQIDPDAEWVSTRSTPDGVELSNRLLNDNLVPNVVDMGLKDALFLLESKGLKVVVEGRGTVRDQSILPGNLVRKGEVITLEMSIKEG
jgi:cell division protein FtsI (penicillin-binding protein 3)